jgi:hypothetical protein
MVAGAELTSQTRRDVASLAAQVPDLVSGERLPQENRRRLTLFDGLRRLLRGDRIGVPVHDLPLATRQRELLDPVSG